MADIARNNARPPTATTCSTSGRPASCSPGTEVKSLRDGKAQLKDGYAALRDGEVWLYNVHIPPYAPATRENHEPERPRKLLMHRREIERLIGKTREKGLTLVPTRMYFKGSHAKVEIALARGKDVGDKRQLDQGARDEARDGAGYTSLSVRARCVRSIPTPSSTSSPT